jgi:hypothetical protein
MAEVLAILGGVSAAAGLADIGFRVCKDLHTFYQNVKDAPKQWTALCDELDMMVRILQTVSLNPKDYVPRSTSTSLDQTWNEVDNLLKEMETKVKTLSLTGMGRVKWPFTEEENKMYLERIARYVQWLNLALGIEQTYTPIP